MFFYDIWKIWRMLSIQKLLKVLMAKVWAIGKQYDKCRCKENKSTVYSSSIQWVAIVKCETLWEGEASIFSARPRLFEVLNGLRDRVLDPKTALQKTWDCETFERAHKMRLRPVKIIWLKFCETLIQFLHLLLLFDDCKPVTQSGKK